MNIFENIERTGYIRKKKEERLTGHQSSDLGFDKETLKKEFRENSVGKLDLLELTVGKLAGCLSRSENAKIINEIVEKDGASEELAEKIFKYWERLGNRKVIPENNAKETFRHIETNLLTFIEKAKKKGVNQYKEVIKEEFNSLEDYLNLLKNHTDFERQELGSVEGYLKTSIGEKNSRSLKGKREEYIKTCKELLEPPINNNL